MKILKYVLPLVLLISLVISGCGKKAEADGYSDSEFKKSLVSGLEKRWDYIDKENNTDTKEAYKKETQMELDAVSEYRNKKFKNEKLQQLAVTYVNNLNDFKKILKYYGSEEFNDKWDDAQTSRRKTLSEINKISKLEVDSQYKNDWDQVLGSGRAAADKDSKKNKIDALIASIKFTAEPKDYDDSDYTTYYATVENNTGFEIKSFSADVKVKNAEGVAVDHSSINAENWGKNEKVKMDFMTDKQMDSYEVKASFIDY
ncbi:FxLYD domain-containing protein [Companilactobacillus mishanensis]|uniref:Uncharacterized protein n=1 Tax=Companilactobacillus mishanensis TaxID=2486008 RepID=A0A5P0ZFL4_9LACO|nr:FxLYD domain-containing protein [Companilactobacillus mishanensis]MQS51779.1 hypothetical protein [Companilactobacillus mishanensis]